MAAFIVAVGIILVIVIIIHYLRSRGRISDVGSKSVFITGSDKGFGLEIALALERQGIIVYAGCHSEHGAQTIRDRGSNRLRPIVVEVTSRDSVLAARRFIEQNLPPGEGLWALVNNAGIVRGILFDFAQQEDYRQVLDVNLHGTINVTEVMSPLIKRTRGRIVNMISIMGRCSLAAGPYSCSKFALEAYSDGLRRSMKSFGVHVAIVEPGFYHTNMTDRQLWEDEIERLWNKLPADLQLDYGEGYKNKAKKVMGAFIEQPPLSNFNRLESMSADVQHALLATHPKARYIVGVDAHIMYKPASLLPDFVLDFFMSHMLREVTASIGLKKSPN